ncbi:MAG: hypothetical protein ACK5MF_15415 [Vibrio sp.]|uniref:hypothetical protein n=1 Tax=Vibrio sp. TaxID=678 RepID=UPI003A867B14
MNTLTLNELTGVTTSLATFTNNFDELQSAVSHLPATDPVHAQFKSFSQAMQSLNENLEVQITDEMAQLVQQANSTWQQISPRLTDH